jgi:hypothetical protein
MFLVFSLTLIDTTWDLNPIRLFPEALQFALQIHHIKFNPIPKTVMTKTVIKWIAKLGIPKNTEFAQRIVEKADGLFLHVTLYQLL